MTEDYGPREISSNDGTEPGTVVHVCNPIPLEAGPKEFELKSILGYIETSSLKKKKEEVGSDRAESWDTGVGLCCVSVL